MATRTLAEIAKSHADLSDAIWNQRYPLQSGGGFHAANDYLEALGPEKYFSNFATGDMQFLADVVLKGL